MKTTIFLIIFLAFSYSNAFSQIKFEDLYTHGYQIKKTRYIKTSDGTTKLISTKTYKFGMTKRSYVKFPKKDIVENEKDIAIAYPNPFTDKVCYFDEKLKEKLHDLKLVNDEGKPQIIEWHFAGNDKIEIDTSELKAGAYLLFVTKRDGMTGSINLFKNR